jgi:hypothetical protein
VKYYPRTARATRAAVPNKLSPGRQADDAGHHQDARWLPWPCSGCRPTAVLSIYEALDAGIEKRGPFPASHASKSA